MSPDLLTLERVNKSFGAVGVLHDVDFAVRAGEVVALVGDNGAGKSTLVKCIAGIHGIDSGTLRFDGDEIHLSGPKAAANLGIEVVYQDLALADNLDIVQNMFLGRERGRNGSWTRGPWRNRPEPRSLRFPCARSIRSGNRSVRSQAGSDKRWPSRNPCCGNHG